MNIEPKTPWRTSERKGIDRRKKDGSREDRLSLATALRAGRNKFYCTCSNCEREAIEKGQMFNGIMLVVCLMLAGLMLLIFILKGGH